MNTRNPLLRISICLAVGGLVTIVIICFLIGFGLHHVVGKYALYTALALQALSLIVNRFADRRYLKACVSYTPSKKMARYRLFSEALWSLGSVCQLIVLLLMLLGMEATDFRLRLLCEIGTILSPLGWMGLLLSSYRRRAAMEVLLARNNADSVEVR